MIIADDMATVAAVADALAALHAKGVITVVRIKNRFDEPSGGGWRDVMVSAAARRVSVEWASP